MGGFLDGLSAMGTNLAQFGAAAGLEAQKADLAKSSMVLADQLTGTREAAAASALAGTNKATAAQLATTNAAAAVLSQQSEKDIGAARNAASIGVANIGAAGTLAAENARAASAERINTETTNSMTPEEKLYQDLGVINRPARFGPQGGGANAAAPSNNAAPSGGPGGAAGTSGTTPATTSPIPPGSTTGAAQSGGSPAPSTTSPLSNAQQNPIAAAALAKLTGQGLPGSEQSVRFDIAKGVAADPLFKDQPADKQAMEIEARLAVATGKMTDPGSRHTLAQAIANYQVAPLENYALGKEGLAETQAEVLKINPDYQAAFYPEIAKAYAGFGVGAQGVQMTKIGSAALHLNTFDQAVEALGNTNDKIPNTLVNVIKTQFGLSSAPNTLDGIRTLVSSEVTRAVTGGLLSEGERTQITNMLSSANSPALLHDAADAFRGMLSSQLQSLKNQYETTTLQKPGMQFAFEKRLTPAMADLLSPRQRAGTDVGGAGAAPPSSSAYLTPQEMYGGPVTRTAPATPPPANRPALGDILRPPQ